MSVLEVPCLSLAISRLETAQTGHYALWVLKAPSPGCYGLRDCLWPHTLSQNWYDWQLMFSQVTPSTPTPLNPSNNDCDNHETGSRQAVSYSSRLMQEVGVGLWQWLFDGTIKSSFDQSQGIAIGKRKPMRLRLDIRDPELTNIPWEIMQPEPGMQAISLGQHLLFSRTTSAVDPLPTLRTEHALKILLVLGQPAHVSDSQSSTLKLELDREAKALANVLECHGKNQYHGFSSSVESKVDILVQPTPVELVSRLDSRQYNILFYSGHGEPGADGGCLFLRSDATLNGTELAQVLTRCQIKLAVFNACWGAQPERNSSQRLIPRSSLAEVLIHHGVPAVLAMRDIIADEEALSFIEVFTQSLIERASIDRAVAIARQQLLTLYRFNQPAWTLPVLYMHPEFNGELIKPIEEGVTEIPDQSPTWIGRRAPLAYLRGVGPSAETWPIQGGMMRVGKMEGNDLIIHEPGVSRQHAEIFYRDSANDDTNSGVFYLRDYSRYGTLVLKENGWQRVHQQEIPLQSQTQLKFGSHRCRTLEFVIDSASGDSS